MEIEIARRFVKLIPAIDSFPREIGIRSGELSLVCIGRTLEDDGKLYHEDGVYDFAYLSQSNSHCIAEIVEGNGTRRTVRFSYEEAGVLLPADPLKLTIPHPGSLRRLHSRDSTKDILERRAGELVIVNDDKELGNSVYSARFLESLNGEGCYTRTMNSSGNFETLKLDYGSIAGALVSATEKCPGEWAPRRHY